MQTVEVEFPKELVLDYNTWVCGIPTNSYSKEGNRLGKGNTQLLNQEGYMCCLGQFCEQTGVPRDSLLGVAAGGDLYDNGWYVKNLIKTEEDGGVFLKTPTNFQSSAIQINDALDISTLEKAQALKDLCEREGHTLVLKNFPETPQ